jgi:hypothetical protein
MIANVKVAERFQGFVNKVQTETTKYYTTKFPSLTVPTIEVEEGSKFYKVVKADSQRSVYCFINKQTGDIYKAATWRAPAKHVRGNISDPNYSWGKGVGLYGGAYLR